MEVSAPQFLLGSVIDPERGGRARLKQHITGEIALRLLLGRSSPLYTGLYADGLLNGSFDYELDYTAGTAMLIAGGESRDVPAVMERLRAYVREITENGVDISLFGKAKKAQFGSVLRLLGSFSMLSQMLVTGAFAGFCPLDALDITDEITIEDISEFITKQLADEKLALSIIHPRV
jgi:predicted Zn-dependent peptidase